MTISERGIRCLSYLPKLPFDALKIDRSFVNELGVRSEVVTLAHNFGMRVIAEGVETERQMELITEIGCNEVQGYLLGRPTADPGPFLEPREGAKALVGAALRGAALPELSASGGAGRGAQARWEKGMDEDLVGTAAEGSADEGAEDRDPPVALW